MGSEARDWIVAGARADLKWETQLRHCVLSDLIPIQASLARQMRKAKVGRLKPGPKWVKPSSVDRKTWDSCLTKAGGFLASTYHPLLQLTVALDSESDQVQACWDLFMSVFNRCFQRDERRVRCHGQSVKLVSLPIHSW